MFARATSYFSTDSQKSAATDDESDVSASLESSLEWLKEQLPESTRDEQTRFLYANSGNKDAAFTQLEGYLKFRSNNSLYVEQAVLLLDDDPSKGTDEDLFDWRVASVAALLETTQPNPLQVLPRLVRQATPEELVALDGSPLLYFMPAQMDETLCPLTTYAAAISIYLDRKFPPVVATETAEDKQDNNKKQEITLMLDVRAGMGWRNPSGLTLLPWITQMLKTTITLFPGRVHKGILFPLPATFTWVFDKTVKQLLDETTAKKIYVLPEVDGDATPVEMLKEHLPEKAVQWLDDERASEFK